MRRLYLLCSALLFTTLLWSQPSFTLDLAERTCPYDSTVTGMFPTAYELFYTRDDTYDGPIDSAYCVSFSLPENNRYLGRLDTAGLPRNRPFYIRYRYPEGDSLPLLPYTGYFVFASVGDYQVNYAPCVENFCNGLRLDYTVRDSATGQTALRQREFSAVDPDFRLTEICLVTERFEQQWLTAVTLRVAIEDFGPGGVFGLYSIEVYNNASFDPVEGLEVPSATPDTEGVFESSFLDALTNAEVNEYSTYYLEQAREGIPAADNVAYTDVNLSPNIDTQATIRLVFYPGLGRLEMPPFTSLRGGLVAGQDSLRHRLELSTSRDTRISPSAGTTSSSTPFRPA